jgi:hypothetical protein
VNADKNVSLLVLNIAPDFINLKAATIKILHMRIEELGVPLSDLNKQTHDGISMRVGHALSRADRISLDQLMICVRRSKDSWLIAFSRFC